MEIGRGFLGRSKKLSAQAPSPTLSPSSLRSQPWATPRPIKARRATYLARSSTARRIEAAGVEAAGVEAARRQGSEAMERLRHENDEPFHLPDGDDAA